MVCRSCGSGKLKKFTIELANHLRTITNVNKPVVSVVATIWLCLICGNAQFSVPERKLRVHRTDEGAAAGSIVN